MEQINGYLVNAKMDYQCLSTNMIEGSGRIINHPGNIRLFLEIELDNVKQLDIYHCSIEIDEGKVIINEDFPPTLK